MNFSKMWIAASVVILIVLCSFEIKYENYAKERSSQLTTRSASALEIPGFIVNKCALRFYCHAVGTNDYTIWACPIRVLVWAIYVSLSAFVGLIVSLFLFPVLRSIKVG
jgi:hypothetical protein